MASMASWFRRSNSATAPQKARTGPVDPRHTEKRHGSNASFEDVEIAELRNSGGLSSMHEDGAGNESAAQGVMREVVQEAHAKERRLLAKLQTQEQTIRQKDQQMAVLKSEIAELIAQVDGFGGPVSSVSFGSTHREDSVDEYRDINTENKQTQPDSLWPVSYHSGDCDHDHEVALLAAATEISAKEMEIQKLKEQNAKLAETAKTDSTDSCTIETLQRELKTVKNENVTLKKQASVLKDELTVTEGEQGFDIVSKTCEVLLKKDDQIEALMKQVDEFITGADKAEQLEEHSRVQSKHVMELKQELGATQITYDELKDYTESLEGMVEDLESTVQSLRGSLQRANAASGTTDSTYWEETIRANMAEIEDCRAKLRGSKKRERETRTEMEDTRRELSEQSTVLEIARTEAAIYKEDFEAERKDRETAHAKIEEIREQCAKDVLVLTEQNRSLILEVEKYKQGRMKDARALQLTHELKESRNEVRAKNVQVRQYKKQVDELTFKATELERHNKDLVQEMSKVRNELVKHKKKGDKNSQEASSYQQKYEQEHRDREVEMKSAREEIDCLNKKLHDSQVVITDLKQGCEVKKEKLEFFQKEFDAAVVDLRSQLDQLKTRVSSKPAESENAELTRYRITSYQPLKGDSFSAAGAFGSVHRVQVNNIPCIAKKILDILVGREREEAVSDEEKHAIKLRFQKECVLLSRMRHPNIVQFMGVCYPNQDPLDLTLIMEFLPMDLEKCLKKYPNLLLPIKLSILYDVSYGLLHLHNASIIHRDLSAANILLTPDMRAKIADLGVSKIIDVTVSKLTKVPGAVAYMSPEALADTPKYSIKLDIFSFGVLALYVANQAFPKFSWELPTAQAIAEKSTEIHRRKVWIDLMGQDHNLYPVVVQCLQDMADQRPTTERLNLTLKQLSQDHPREITDIVHLEQELAKQNQEVSSLVQEREHLKKQLADAEVQRIPPAVVFPTDPAHSPQPPYPVRYQKPSSAYGTAGGAQYQANPPPLTKSISVPGIHQMQYATPQHSHYYSTLPRVQHQAGHPEGRWMDPPIREDPNLSCDACGMKFAVGEEEALAEHVKTCDIYQ